MAQKTNGVSKSDEVRQMLKANPEVGAKEVVTKLAEKGIKISNALFYFTKGQMKGRKARKSKDQKKAVSKTTESTTSTRIDSVATIIKVKALARDVGGMKTLLALVEALSD